MSLTKAREEYEQNMAAWIALMVMVDTFAIQAISSEPYFRSLSSRVKAWPTIAEKLSRKAHTEHLSDIRDIVGLRVVVAEPNAIPVVLERLGVVLEFEQQSRNESRWHDDPRFQSVNVIGRIRPQDALSPEWHPFQGQPVEIQVRSALANAWDKLEHDLAYRLPEHAPAVVKLQAGNSAVDHLNSIIDEFEALLGKPDVHEKQDVHPFLVKHPFLLHPNPDDVLSERPIGLGTEYRMDFLIREADGSYVVVEIENPNHALVTRNGDIAAPVNHAQQQIEDWQEWIEDNLPTVQRYYPDISAPRGLVVIGRSRSFSRTEHRKIARRNINLAGRVKIVTYDELLTGARSYTASLRKTLNG